MRKLKRSIFDVLQERPYGLPGETEVFSSSKDCRGFVERLCLCRRLPVHAGCVNTIWWNSTGTRLLSGSDDHHLKVTEPYSGKVLVDYRTEHRANIFSAKFMPFSGDNKIVSCSGDGAVLYTDLQEEWRSTAEGRPPHLFLCAAGTTYELLTWDDANCFLSGGEEGAVRCWDLRLQRACAVRGCAENIIVTTSRAVTSMALNPTAQWELSVATADGYVCQYDRRCIRPRHNDGELNRWTAPGLRGPTQRVTALKYSADGRQLLVSYSAGDLYLFDLCEHESLVAPSAAAAAAGPARPPVKRLRLRGDWSDTGPQARPEREARPASEREAALGPQEAAEAAEEAPERPRRSGVALHASLINQMSEVLQRLLHSEMPAPPDLSTRPVTRRVMERIRERRANMRQMVQSMGDLHTEDPSESEVGVAAAPVEADPAARPSSCSEVESDEGSAGRLSPRDGSHLSPSASGAAAQNEGERESTPASRLPQCARELRCPAPGNSAAAVVPDGAAGGAAAAADVAADATVSGIGGAAAAAAPVVEPPGPYLDMEPPTVVVRSEPLLNLYYNPQSSTAGQISVQSPQSTLTSTATDASSQPTFAERAVLLSCGSGQVPDALGAGDTDCTREREEDEEERQLYTATDKQPRLYQRFTGHRNARTMIKEANFWGSQHVMSGSDCGHVFIWDRLTGRLVTTLEADRHVVNCIQPHPLDPLLATSGIDYDIKLWAPLAEESMFDRQRAEELMSRNALMLEETRDTITVPASFMIRMLASLSSRRARQGEDS